MKSTNRQNRTTRMTWPKGGDENQLKDFLVRPIDSIAQVPGWDWPPLTDIEPNTNTGGAHDAGTN
jgi:hypothetical protein